MGLRKLSTKKSLLCNIAENTFNEKYEKARKKSGTRYIVEYIVECCVWKIVEFCIFRKDLFANLLNFACLSCSILHV